MGKGRLEAFSDGVIAIIITIMVLELHAPHSPELSALLEIAPSFLAYVLSFIYVAIYWNNHHHMMHAIQRIDGGVLWANNALLFSLSLVPFASAWVGDTNFAAVPLALYGLVMMLPGTTYFVLTRQLIRVNGPDCLLAKATGSNVKEWLSLVLYALGIGLTFAVPLAGFACYVLVAIMWLIPDRRIARALVAKQ